MATQIRYISSVVHETAKNKKYQVVATTQMQVQFDLEPNPALRVGPDAALNLAGVPNLGDAYRYNSSYMENVLCIERDSKQRGIEHYHWFDVTIQYESPLDGSGYESNPLLERTKYSYGFVQFQKQTEKDIGGFLIKNSAGDAFVDKPTIDDSRPAIRVKRNEPYFPVATMQQYQDAVNTDIVRINGVNYPVGTLKMQNIESGDIQERNGLTFYTVTYTLEYQRGEWPMVLLDQGFRYLSGGVLKTAVSPDDNRTPLATASLLNGSGGLLAVGGTPTYLSWDVYKQKAFSVLGL